MSKHEKEQDPAADCKGSGRFPNSCRGIRVENSANNGGPIDIIKQLLDEVIPLFKTFLKIKTKSQINEPKLNDLINTRCNVNITQENITEIINENDITIFPYFKDFNQSEDEDITWMRGKFCLITRDLRPIGGFLEINEKINIES